MSNQIDFRLKHEVKENIDVSTPSNIKLGKNIFDKKEVEITEYSENKIRAFVLGGERRKVEFVSSQSGLRWKCTCKNDQKTFCKHAIALGFEIMHTQLI